MLRIVICLALTASCVVAECNSGWVKFGDLCLAFSDDKLTWFDSLTVCNALGGRLVQIESEKKHTWIVDQLKTRGIGDTWTAGSIRYSGEWEWIPTYKKISSYKNWAPSEPNNPKIEKCLDLQANQGHRWNDESCFTAAAFICEKPDK
ncbi:hypothetical protein BsWGS_23787 [Bradybaena similaris]